MLNHRFFTAILCKRYFNCLQQFALMSTNSTTSLYSFEAAIRALNGLQSNAAVIDAARRAGKNKRTPDTIQRFIRHLAAAGMEPTDLNALNAVHVSGTKGKGSTCSFSESIFRAQGLRTGLYTSPHLVSVRERIQVGRQPLSEPAFAAYFWDVYSALKANLGPDEPMPAYFSFLTILAFRIFLAEKVDVAVVEVGIGGTYDCTNVIPKPVITAVTCLDLDHVSILGDTVEEIAVHKGGIFKPNVLALTVPQEGKSLTVLRHQAMANQTGLYLVPPVSAYAWPNDTVVSGIPGDSQYWNIALALQIAHSWHIRRSYPDLPLPVYESNPHASLVSPTDPEAQCIPVIRPFPLTKPIRKGLRTCRWPGRSQVIRKLPITYFIDGAHTRKSIQFCANWFLTASAAAEPDVPDSPGVTKVLVFNCTGDRHPSTLIPFLTECDFDVALFCPNVVSEAVDPCSELTNLMTTREAQMKKCNAARDAYVKAFQKRWEHAVGADCNPMSSSNNIIGEPHRDCVALVLPSVNEVFDCLKSLFICHTADNAEIMTSVAAANSIGGHSMINGSATIGNENVVNGLLDERGIEPCQLKGRPAEKVHVLVTGSLHLVGAFLGCIDVELKGI